MSLDRKIIYAEDSDLYGIEVGIGAEAIHRLLQEMDLEEIAEKLREEITQSKGQKTRSFRSAL